MSDSIRGVDVERVTAWFEANIPGATGPLTFDLIAGGHSNLTFSVTDAGDPVRGAVVKAGGRSGKTDRNGRVTLRVSSRKLRVTATLKGYSNARLTLK